MKKFNVTDVRRKNSTTVMTEDQIIAKYGNDVKLDGTVERFGKFFMVFDEIAPSKPKASKPKKKNKKTEAADETASED